MNVARNDSVVRRGSSCKVVPPFFYLSSKANFTTSTFPLFFFKTLSVTSSPGILSFMISRRVTPSPSGVPAASVIISQLSRPALDAGELATIASADVTIRSPFVIFRLILFAISGVSGMVRTPTKARLMVPFFSTEFMRY